MDAPVEVTSVARADKAVGAITCIATVWALGLSYLNQLDFATQVGGYPVWAALVFPLIIDSFVVVGELRLYTATVRDEHWRIKLWAWVLTLAGLAASMAANMEHVGWHAPAGKIAAAGVPPLAAAAALATGLGLVKLRARSRGSTGQPRQAAGATPPTARAAAERAPARSSGQPSAEQLLAWVTQDQLDGLPMGRVSFQRRHDISEHHAKRAVAMVRNGG
jgi:hypothetical protein